MFRSMVIAVLCLGAVGCGDDAPTGPTRANVSGTWRGTLTQVGLGTLPLQLTITQNDDDVSGTWTLANGDSSAGGTLGGVVTGSGFSVAMRQGNPADPCVLELAATVTGNQLAGTFAAVRCPEPAGGSVSLSK